MTYSSDVAGGAYYSSLTQTYYKTLSGAQQAEAKYLGSNPSPIVPTQSYTPSTPTGGTTPKITTTPTVTGSQDPDSFTYGAPVAPPTQITYNQQILQDPNAVSGTPSHDQKDAVLAPVTPLSDYVEAATREAIAQDTKKTSEGINTTQIQLNEINADVGTQKVLISEAQTKLDVADAIVAENLDIVNENIATMAAMLENPDKYNWATIEGGYEGFVDSYQKQIETLAAYNLYLENRPIYAQAIDDAKGNLVKLQKYQSDFKEEVNAKNLTMLTKLAGAIAGFNSDEADKAKALEEYLKSPEGQRMMEFNSQNTKWKVGDKTFNSYSEAEAYIKAQARLAGYSPESVVMNTPNYLTDAPGMESYVSGLGIPTTGSGIGQAGWVDTQIDNVSGGLHDFGRFLESEAVSSKLKGYDAWAGVYAGGAVAAGAASALFDTSLILAPYAQNQVSVLSEFEKNPLFDTGFIGGNAALILYGGAELYNVAKTRLPASVTKWASEPGGFIDVAHEPLGTPKLTPTGEINAEYWAGKPSTISPAPFDTVTDIKLQDNLKEILPRSLSTRLENGEIAYAMVDLDQSQAVLDSVRTAARTPFMSLDAPLYIYRGAAGVQPAAITVASALGAIGAANLSRSLLSNNQSIINEIASKLNVPNINAVLSKNIQLPVEISDSLVTTLQTLASIQVQAVISDTLQIQAPIEIMSQDEVTDQIQEPEAIPIQEPVEDIVEEPIYEPQPGPEPDVVHPPTPDIEEPLVYLPLAKGKKVEERKNRRGEENEGGVFVVRLRYGRKSVTRSVAAQSFRAALSKVLKGTPSEVEVRRVR